VVRGRSFVVRGALVVAFVLVCAIAVVGAGVIWWSGVTLSTDPSALARLELQPLAGSVRSLTAYAPDGRAVPVARSHGRLTPRVLVQSGEDVRIDVVVRRPSWLGWLLGHTRRETLSVTTPVAAVVDRWPTLARGAPLELRFTTRVDRVQVAGLGARRTYSAPGRRLSLRKSQRSGTIEVALAARSWERLARPVDVTWFPTTHGPAVQVSPRPGTEISALTPIRLTFAKPVGTARPHFTQREPGNWQLVDSHTLLFRPASVGFAFGSSLRVRLPARVTVVRRSTTSTAQTLGWTVAAGSLLRLHQLLAQEAYLPVVWNAAGADVSRTPAAEVAAAIDPPAGSFAWRFPNTPPQLARQWNPNEVTQITRGAVMMFEHEHGLTVDGFAGPNVWHALLADAIAGKQHSGGYSYVYVHTSLPQLLTLWHDGQTILTSPGNTGIPATPTQPGTYPVFEHIPVGEMKGTNPDGSHYDDKGIQWISYFHGGDALHSFNRASFGTPQSLGCVELPLAAAAKVWPYTPIGTLVTIENPS